MSWNLFELRNLGVGWEEALSMQSLDVADYARQLVEIRGDMALADATRKARNCEKNGDKEAAAMWRRIQSALTTFRSPHVS
jgi:hypothetical protein